ncbi:GspH/FimT family pseudopilin [Aquabacterium sp.]|uniref:GspH/FimT family pseudopilin n=1 Tax=Aquabacterium sp. TaxID=1872578 RepID=UPI003D0808F3
MIELMVGITLLAILVGMGVPAFSEWLQNARIRAAAESIQTGLQHAKAEAVRRNTHARFQLVSTLDNDCAVSTSGTFWLVNLTSDTTPDNQCGSTPSDTTSPFILQRSPAGGGGDDLDISASQYVVSFNGLGRQIASTNPTTSIGTLTINVRSASTTCLGTSGGTARCLRIVVSPAGQIRMCDPSITGTGVSTQTHPTSC